MNYKEFSVNRITILMDIFSKSEIILFSRLQSLEVLFASVLSGVISDQNKPSNFPFEISKKKKKTEKQDLNICVHLLILYNSSPNTVHTCY